MSSCDERHTDLLRFATKKRMANYTPVPEAGCWLWLGSWTVGDKYGRVRHDDDQRHIYVTVPRLFYAFHVGPIPQGMDVCHKCDTPPCVNPAHLFVGTRAENAADMVRKGRASRRAKALDSASALAVYQSPESLRVTARRFGISKTTVINIRQGISWRSVTGHNMEQANG